MKYWKRGGMGASNFFLLNHMCSLETAYNASYNTIFMPPKVEGICDKCGSTLVKRKDDNPETIKQRLEVYYKNTAPLIEYYKNENLLESVDINIYSATTKEDTTAKSIAKIEEHLK